MAIRLVTTHCPLLSFLKKALKGGSPGRVVMGRDSRSKGCGFESRPCILDGHFCTYISCLNCIGCLKRPKINQNEAGVAQFFKKPLVLFEITNLPNAYCCPISCVQLVKIFLVSVFVTKWAKPFSFWFIFVLFLNTMKNIVKSWL